MHIVVFETREGSQAVIARNKGPNTVLVLLRQTKSKMIKDLDLLTRENNPETRE